MNNNQNVNNPVNNPRTPGPPLAPAGSDDLRYHGTELVMLYDYKVGCTWLYTHGQKWQAHGQNLSKNGLSLFILSYHLQ